LATSDGVHGVDGRDTGGDHFFGVHLDSLVMRYLDKNTHAYSRVWVDRTAVDVEVVLCEHLRALVDSST
jgi:hypothetical protein